MASGKETDVIIQGLGGKLPAWASERTLKEMNRNLVKVISTLQGGKGGEGGASDEIQKTAEELKDFDKAMQALRNDGVNKTTDGFIKVTSGVKAFGSGLATSFSASGIIGIVLKNFKQLSQTMLGLYDSGLTFQDGMGSFIKSAGRAGMSLDDYAELVVKNSAVLKAFGEGGDVALSNVLKSTRNLIKEQGYYGMNISQINGYTADYLEILRRQGSLNKMSQGDQAKASANYIKELTSYSQIIGKSRDQINKEIQDQTKKPMVQAALNAMAPEARKVLMSTIGTIAGTFKDPATSEAFQNLIQEAALTPYGAMNELSMAIGSVAPQLNKKILDFAQSVGNGSITEEEANKKRREILQGLQGLSKSQLEQIKNFASIQSSLQGGSLALSSIFSELQGIDLSKVNSTLAEQPDKFTKAMVTISNLFNDISRKFQEIFGNFIVNNQARLGKIADGITAFADTFAKHLSKILDNIIGLFDEKTRAETIDQIKEGSKDFIKEVFKMLVQVIKEEVIPYTFRASEYSLKYVPANIKSIFEDEKKPAQKTKAVTKTPTPTVVTTPPVTKTTQTGTIEKAVAPTITTTEQSPVDAKPNNSIEEMVETNKQILETLQKMTDISSDNLDVNNSIKRMTSFNTNIGL